MGIKDEYTAFCFDEACTSILFRLRNKETPHYRQKATEEKEVKEYSNFSSFYNDVLG